MKVLCDEIQAVDERVFLRQEKLNDLIINVPPGTSKTKILSVLATAWEFARKPDLRIFVGSYSDTAVKGIAEEVKTLMKSEKYQAYFPETRIKKGRDTIHLFKTTVNGEFYAFTVGGTITSKHADILKIDDPINPKEAASDVGLKTANDFFSQTLPTRKVDKKVTPTILIMQRLHANDPTGYILSRKEDKLRHVCLPAELSDRVNPPEYRANYTNGLLDEKRLDREILAEMKTDLGSIAYAGQFEQSPTVPGGYIIKKDWWKTVSPETFDLLRGPNDPIIFFGDTAYTENSEDNDPSGFIGTCKVGNNLYITVAKKVFMEFPALCKFLPGFVTQHGYTSSSSVRIEPKANGLAVIQQLKTITGLNITNTKSPKDDKKTRLTAESPKVECGRIILVAGTWNEEFIDEVCGFPNKPHDEYVDLLAYAGAHHLPHSAAQKTTSQNAKYFRL